MPENDVNAQGDRLIGDLLCWARKFGKNVTEVDEPLQNGAHSYYRSLLWMTIPVRLADCIELPPVSGEIEGR